jgi:hypothetical protein
LCRLAGAYPAFATIYSIDQQDTGLVTNPTAIASPLCALCGKPVDLKNCKIDENGQAVHADCLLHKLTEPKPPSKHS